MLTWNLWAIGDDHADRLEAVAEVLQREEPDICCLQEVRVDGDLDGGRHLASRLGLHLIWELPPSPGWWRRRVGGDALVGNAVLSRWPTSDHLVTPLPIGDGPDEGRSALKTRVTTPFGALLVVSTQLTSAPAASALRCAQVRALAEAALGHHRTDETLIVAGDLNAEPDSDEVRLLCGHKTTPAAEDLVLVDVWRYAPVADPGWTWDRCNPHVAHTGEPSSRIDFILAGPTPAGRLPLFSQVGIVGDRPVAGTWPSDHAGVRADLVLDD